MSLSLIDILFLVTVVLLVLNGLRNGFVFSLVNLLGLPLGLAVAYLFGPTFTAFLAANGLQATPLISYLVLFFGTVLIVHILGNVIRAVVRRIPLIGQGDALLGGLIGFVEAWLIWLLLLAVLGGFLTNVQTALTQGSHIVQGVNLAINLDQFRAWHDFYNDAVTHSLFAQVNGFFIKVLPGITAPQPLQ